MPDPREPYGQIVNETRIAFAAEQEDDRGARWFIRPWEERAPGQRELDMRIGSAVAVRAVADADIRLEQLDAENIRLHKELLHLRARCDERDRLISALIAEHPVELGRFSRMLSDAALGQERGEEKGADRP